MSNRIAKGVSARLLQYLREEGISEELPAITELLQHEVDRRQIITVISAAKLTESAEDELRVTLTEKWGKRSVTFTVDHALLSGMIISFRDQVIDMSGKHSLTDLSQKLS